MKWEKKLIYLESCSRHETVRIYGVLGGSEKGSPTMALFVEKMLVEGLELAGDAFNFQIERVHRTVGPQPPGDG